MKEYSLQEVFEETEGTEFITMDNKYRVKVLRGELVHTNSKPCAFIGYYTKIKFIKAEQPVSFMEVINSDNKCKIEHHRIDALIEDDENIFGWLKEYQSIDCIMDTVAREFNTTAFKDIIKNAKFYLENKDN